MFYGDSAVVYHLQGTTGWEAETFGGRPIALWKETTPTSITGVGVRDDQLGFIITGTSNLVVVVEACTNLANPVWSQVGTNTLNGGSSYFSDPHWSNYSARFYRLRSP